MGQDVRLAFRMLRDRPGFAAAAIATLALGIGASTAIFSVAYGVSLRPLPYPQPGRLIRIAETNPANEFSQHVSMGAFHVLRETAGSIEAASLYTRLRSRRQAGPDGQPLTSKGVSPAFFDVLGVRPILGAGFKPEREYTRADRELVLSYRAWQRLFHGRPDVIGAPFLFNDDDSVFRVVGVMPEDFSFTQSADVWQSKPVNAPVPRSLYDVRSDAVIARLKPAATIVQARAELEGVAERLAREFPASNRGWALKAVTLHESIVGNFGRATWLLVAVVAVVLLVACLNVRGLLLARALARERETAVRAALGAGAWRLLRQWLAGATLLGALGAGLGVLFAFLGVSALKAAAPPGIPRLGSVALDWPTLVVAGASTLVSILIFTVAPLGRLRGSDVAAGLRSGSGAATGRFGVQRLLTAVQCAGAAALVILAVMFARSFLKLTSFDLGWNPDGVLSVQVGWMPSDGTRPWYRRVEWSDRVIARVQAMPGIERAAVATQLPLGPSIYASTLGRGRGKAASDPARWPATVQAVTDGYFDLMDIQLIAGRTFQAADRFGEPQINETNRAAQGIAIVSEQTARTLWPGESAIGQALWLPTVDNVAWREVVGVVNDIQFHAIGEVPALHVFLPFTQFSAGTLHVLARGTGRVTPVGTIVGPVVHSVEPNTTLNQIVPLESLVHLATAQPRFTSRTVGVFGLVAVLLSAVGIYGLLSCQIAARTRELGIRVALGAQRRRLLSDAIRRGVAPAAWGGAAGLAAAVAVARVFQALLFEVAPLDPGSLFAGALLVAAVSLAATLGPAWRASRVEPVGALRAD